MPDSASVLTASELSRYARHLVLPEVGRGGQLALRAARVALVGVGGLGSPSALYLTAAGVGTLGLIEDDEVDVTNLHRQILHGTADVGRSKLDSAADRLRDINPQVELELHRTRLGRDNAREILGGYDLVLDGSDNFPTRYLVNDACVLLGIPNVYGAILRWEGQASVFAAPGGPCYRCLFREPPPAGLVPNCAEAGVLGVLPGVVGSLQALEAIKWILGRGDSLVGRLLLFDALALRFREIEVPRDPTCPVCGDAPTVTELIDYDLFCGMAAPVPTIHVERLQEELASADPPLLVDVREDFEWEAGHLGHLGACWIPLARLAERAAELPEQRDLVIYCESGLRSARAVEQLRQQGLHRARNLEGGYRAWTARFGSGEEPT